MSAAAQPGRRRSIARAKEAEREQHRISGEPVLLPACRHVSARCLLLLTGEAAIAPLQPIGTRCRKSQRRRPAAPRGFGVVPRTWALSHRISMPCTSGLVHCMRTNERVQVHAPNATRNSSVDLQLGSTRPLVVSFCCLLSKTRLCKPRILNGRNSTTTTKQRYVHLQSSIPRQFQFQLRPSLRVALLTIHAIEAGPNLIVHSQRVAQNRCVHLGRCALRRVTRCRLDALQALVSYGMLL